MVFPHPCRDERCERQPEEQMEVCPKHTTINMFYRLKQVMMVAPVDSEEDKTESIAEEDRQQGSERSEVRPCRRPKFQNHDGDDDGDDTITERFRAAFGHRGFRFTVYGLRFPFFIPLTTSSRSTD